MERKINIGISFFWGESYQHIWSNGAGQNMFFLKTCLEQIDFVNEVYFVYWGNTLDSLPDQFKAGDTTLKFYEYTEVLNRTDVLIEGTLAIEPQLEAAFRQHGTKIITYRMGNDFIMDMEKFVHAQKNGRAFNGTRYDSVWITPHLMKTNKPYVEIITGVAAHEVPHLWEPFFLEQKIKELKLEEAFGYKPVDPVKRRIAVMEPNISVLKNCMTPVLIVEETHRRNKELLEHVYLCGTVDKKDVHAFFNFIGFTSLVRENIMTVEARFMTPEFLSRYSDIVLSYQWECGLNYLYYETIYGNYPLVHNSEYLAKENIGYFYREFDAYDGADALMHCIYAYDKEMPFHQERNKKFLHKVSVYNPENISRHRDLLLQVLQEK
ncbi:DUF2827 family protein [Veillonella criceti]|uniref:Protein of uncharacterized function (DUF2827) n=1 Tax=Veillonella criceti TaxID=103891 RepID=A0A380NHS2_9FIRM|nr:DUF2827 family protein [Veillonella criceti]SUP41015.1 Protein of uncharacterised function (DUF2827) [Veillonella criceti]